LVSTIPCLKKCAPHLMMFVTQHHLKE